MSDGERTRYLDVVTKAAAGQDDPYAPFQLAAAALLQSPHFVYRVELGAERGPSPGLVRFSAYELASRLSYLVWNTTPDDALLDAAASGALATDAGLRAQLARLLSSPRAREGIGGFAAEWMGLAELDTMAKDPQIYKALTPTLRQAMRTEVVRLFEEIGVASKGDLLDLYDGPKTYVNRELGKLYGLEVAGESFQEVTLPPGGPRAGLLGTAAVLSSHSKQHDSSPTKRGRFVREVLLCQPVPDPPPGANDSLPPLTPGASKRQQLAEHRANPACASCHALTDPLGFGLENFDALGAFRAEQAGVAIDPSGELDGVPFARPRELARLVRGHREARACLVRSFFRYATGRADDEAERRLATALAPALDRGGNRLASLLEALVQSDSFRLAAAPQTP
jgi:hypothetical protein